MNQLCTNVSGSVSATRASGSTTAAGRGRGNARSAGIATIGALVLALGAVLAPAAQGAPNGPRFGDSYRLSSTGVQGETPDVSGLAVDPANPNHIVEANIDPLNLQCDYHVSFDGGKTWDGGHLTLPGGSPSPGAQPFPSPACDQNFDSGGYAHFNTGIVFGSGQNVYVTWSIHRGPFNRPESNLDGGEGDDAVVARSTDGGRTFGPGVIAVPGGGPVAINPGLAGIGMRPQIAVQRSAGTGGRDRLYVDSWNCYIRVRASQTTRGGCSGGGGDRRIWVARSDNGGDTWNAPVLASAANVRTGTPSTPGSAAAEAGSADEQAVEPAQPVVGPDGAVYVAYKNRDITDGTTCPVNPEISGTAPGGFTRTKANCVVVARSTNQGATWTQVGVQPFNGAVLIHPRLAIDPNTLGGTRPTGTLYVVYQRRIVATEPAGTDIFLRASTDGGMTWGAEVKVNDDPAGPIQTNPWVSVGSGGEVDVIWQDRRHDYPGGRKHGDIYFARSTNGGATFAANRRITDRTINTDVGRYNDLGADFTPGFDWFGPVLLPLPGGKLLASWTDSRLGNFDNGFQDIFLSSFDPNAAIVKRSMSTATPSGLSVQLSRLAYPGGSEAIGGNGGDPVSKVVVANEGDVAGALAGAVLARANYAPLLLSPAGGMPAVSKAESARFKPEGGFVIGDNSALSTAVFNDLLGTTRNGENVQRIAPAGSVAANNRAAETARQIAELMRPLPGTTPEAVIVDPSRPEAAAASALAAALKEPILFVDSRTTLPPPTNSAIDSLGIKKALIVGGTGAVNAGIETALVTKLGAPNVKRVGGADAASTSEAMLTEARTVRGLPINTTYVANAARPIDGALLGSAVGRLNGGMLLTASASTDVADTRLGVLGVDGAVDRITGAVGTGGTDPTLPSTPSPTIVASGVVTTGTTGSVASDTTAPGVSSYGLTNSTFAVGGRTPLFGSAARARKGTTFRYTLSEAATVKIVIARGRTGRRSGKRCVAPTRKLRNARKCVRLSVVGTLTRTSHAGVNSVGFSGRIGSKALAPGNYQATLTATDAVGNTSKPRAITFRIVRR